MAEEKQLIENHDCDSCACKRVILNTTNPIEKEDGDVFERISTMVNNTDQLLKIPAPEAFSDKDREAYFKAVIDKHNEARCLLSEWWTSMMKKYGIPNFSKFDAFNCVFYYCENEDGTANVSGEYIPKDSECDCEDGCCGCKK
mgnify:FL=1